MDKDKNQITSLHLYTVQLSAGNYTAGIDLPYGIYSLVASGGYGNVIVINKDDQILNLMMSSVDKELFTTSSDKVPIRDGATLCITSSLVLTLSSDQVDTNFSCLRKPIPSNSILLSSGIYYSGIDFPPGIYNITSIYGNGFVSTSNISHGGLNESMNTKVDNFSIKEFKNACLFTGTQLTIISCDIKLTPVKHL